MSLLFLPRAPPVPPSLKVGLRSLRELQHHVSGVTRVHSRRSHLKLSISSSIQPPSPPHVNVDVTATVFAIT